ncbi:MAG: hypothetical protein ACOCQ4_01735 [bacterium]
MNIETNWVRVISNTKHPKNLRMNEMVGKECKVGKNNYNLDSVDVWFDDIDWYPFNKSDVRFLTPIKFKDRYIAIGDKIKWDNDWYEVISFAEPGKVKVLFIGNERESFGTNEDKIEDHDPGIETDEEYIEIDGEKWSKSTIKEALKNKLK